MRIRDNFSCSAYVLPGEYVWVVSPQSGVSRVMLDRIGSEKARATSLVRYEADASFARHEHPGGEEILVLSGVFSDEHGHYPEGFYLRNPSGSGHLPSSAQGTIIFVKLWQMHPDDRQMLRVNTRDSANWQRYEDRDICKLHHMRCESDGYREEVMLVRLMPDAVLMESAAVAGGVEILVLEGALCSQASISTADASHSTVHPESIEYAKGTWIRLPAAHPGSPDSSAQFRASDRGATCYVKTGHLARVLPAEPFLDV